MRDAEAADSPLVAFALEPWQVLSPGDEIVTCSMSTLPNQPT